ncbi:carnitine/acylcarnitine translocase, partial [Tribonema minus]
MVSLSESVIDFVAGWCSGAVGILVTQPLDCILVRRQANAAPARQALAHSFSSAGGLKALWKGTSIMMGTVPAQNALLFAGYGAGLHWSGADKGDGTSEGGQLWHVFVGGCAGGLAQSFLASPVELLKVRLQLQATAAAAAPAQAHAAAAPAAAAALKPSSGAIAMAARLTLGGGAGGGGGSGARSFALPSVAWAGQGLSATLWRDVLPHGVWFASYEAAKRALAGDAAAGPLDPAAQVAAGATAATAAWCVGYPADVVKTRMQAHGASGSFAETVARMHAAEGVRVFWRGLGLKLARAIPMSAIGFFAYEEVAAYLRALAEH